MTKKITIEDIEQKSSDGKYFTTSGDIIPSEIRTYAKERGIEIIESRVGENILKILSNKFQNFPKENIHKIIKEEIEKKKYEIDDLKCFTCQLSAKHTKRNRAIISTSGMNKAGILAALANTLAELNVDIEDISQTIVSDFFSMIMVVNLTGLNNKNLSFKEFKESMFKNAKAINIEMTVTHEDIVTSMQRI